MSDISAGIMSSFNTLFDTSASRSRLSFRQPSSSFLTKIEKVTGVEEKQLLKEVKCEVA